MQRAFPVLPFLLPFLLLSTASVAQVSEEEQETGPMVEAPEVAGDAPREPEPEPEPARTERRSIFDEPTPEAVTPKRPQASSFDRRPKVERLPGSVDAPRGPRVAPPPRSRPPYLLPPPPPPPTARPSTARLETRVPRDGTRFPFTFGVKLGVLNDEPTVSVWFGGRMRRSPEFAAPFNTLSAQISVYSLPTTEDPSQPVVLVGPRTRFGIDLVPRRLGGLPIASVYVVGGAGFDISGNILGGASGGVGIALMPITGLPTAIEVTREVFVGTGHETPLRRTHIQLGWVF